MKGETNMENNLSNAEFVNRSIYVDRYSEVFYGADQVFIRYPARFATVTFCLESSDGLIELADAERVKAGYMPFIPTEQHPEEVCDMEGWYDFYISIDNYADDHMESCIEAVVCNSYQDDNEQMYYIEIPDEARSLLFNRLDEQARECYGMSCLEMLEESNKEMVEYDEWRYSHAAV